MKKILSIALASSIALGGLGVLPVCAAESTTTASAVESAAVNPVILENNDFNLLGLFSQVALKITFNPNTMTLSATGRSISTHTGFYDTEYFRVEIKSIYGYTMFSEGVNGTSNTLDIAKRLNNFVLQEGDRIYIYHKEAVDRLQVTGAVINAPFDLSKGMGVKNTYEDKISFKVTSDGLVYKGMYD